MIEEEHTIVSGLLQKPSRFFDIRSIKPEVFEDIETRSIVKIIFRYRNKKQIDVDFPLFKAILERSKSDKAPILLDLAKEYEEYDEISDSEFMDAVGRLTSYFRKEQAKKTGAKGLTEMVEGDWDSAKESFRSALDIAEDDFFADDRPTNIKLSSELDLERQNLMKPPAQIGGFDIGFKKITSRVSLRKKELTIIGGYTADGKTQLSKTIAYNANMNSKANVLYVALEMDKREMLVLFLAQHAARMNSKGLYYRDILDGTASSDQKKLYLQAMEDFQIDSHDDTQEIQSAAGALHVWAPLKEINAKDLTDRVKSVKSDGGLDIVVVDYLELVQPTKELGQYRLNVKYLCERSKSLAREEDVWMILNHQISRSGRDAAEKRTPKHYLLRDLGESAGVERAADHVLWIYSDEDFKSNKEAKVGIAKARKGGTLKFGTHIMADYQKSLLGEIEEDDDEY